MFLPSMTFFSERPPFARNPMAPREASQPGTGPAKKRQMKRKCGIRYREKQDWREILFVPQRFDGIEFGRFHRRPHAKNQPNGNADGNSGERGPHRHASRPFQSDVDEKYQ